jgi:pimeloyl-ACP methyl ester carboxylesterase
VWSGTAKVGKGKEITFKFDIKRVGQDYKTIISIPSARVSGLEPKQTTFKNDKLIVDGSNLGLRYEGDYSKEKQEFKGQFNEGPNIISLTLKKGQVEQKISKSNRPQEPVKPYPYLGEEVTFTNKKANVVLAGTFTKPKKEGKYPVALLISGSGPSDRDETFANHKPFLVLSDYLTRKGIAVLRYDDRGRGSSTGDFSKATTLNFANDAASAIAYLKTRNDVDFDNIGIIGHSEGGIIAPIVANKMKKDIAFIISLAGTGIPGSELSLIQSKTLRPFPVPDEVAYETAIRKAITIASKKGERKEIKKELLQHYNESIMPILQNVVGSKEQAAQIINQVVETRTTPWSRYFYNYNPADEYKKVKCPVLALYGTKDTQVLANINAPALEAALKKGKTKDYEVKVFDGLNHFFQEAETGKMSEYETIEQTISPQALNKISNWIFNTIQR